MTRFRQLPETQDPYKLTAAPNELPAPQSARAQAPQANDVQTTRPLVTRPPSQTNIIRQSVRPSVQSSDTIGRRPAATTSGQTKKMVQPTLSWAKGAQQPPKINYSSSPQPQVSW